MQGVRLAGLRRFVLVVVLTLGGGIALAGCQTQPGTAAYVGDTRFTDQQIDAMVATIDADVVKAQPGAAGQIKYGDLRQRLVQLELFNELARRYAAEQRIDVPARDYQAAARQVGLPADDPFVTLSTDFDAYQKALTDKAEKATPTEADLKSAYDTIVKAGVQVGAYADVKDQIAALPTLPAGLGLRRTLTDAAGRYGVGVSPRYSPPVEVPLASVNAGNGSAVPIVTLALGQATGSPAARDLS